MGCFWSREKHDKNERKDPVRATSRYNSWGRATNNKNSRTSTAGTAGGNKDGDMVFMTGAAAVVASSTPAAVDVGSGGAGDGGGGKGGGGGGNVGGNCGGHGGGHGGGGGGGNVGGGCGGGSNFGGGCGGGGGGLGGC